MSGFSAGGGPVFAASANADAVFALMKILADPKLYQERLGDLTAAEEAARDQEEKARAAMRDATDKQTAAMDALVKLDADRAAHRKASADLDARAGALQEDISRREVALQEGTAELKDRKADFDSRHEAWMQDMANRENLIGHKEVELREREKTLVLREQSVAAKLAKIREIDQAG